MTIVKALIVTTIAVLIGVVGYKVIKRKNPELIENTKNKISKITSAPTEFLKGAKDSFREGYASA